MKIKHLTRVARVGYVIVVREDKEIVKRINVIAGQLKGISRMVEEKRNFLEIITQIASVKASLEQIEDSLIEIQEKNLDKETMKLFKIFKSKYIKQTNK
jgi:DNA-binding FrmR family transcriptional regulator